MLDNPTMNLHGPHGAQMPIREPLWAKIVAGGGAGMIGAAIANPTDLIKVRMQAQSEAATHSVMQIVMGIVRSEGLRGLYRGVGPTTQRAIILTASQLPSYDHSKRTLLDSGYFREGIITHFVCSMFAGFVCATTTSPIDLVKSRYMNQKFGSDGVGLKYKTSFDCFKKTLMTEGVAGLFKGWLPQWMRMGPHTIMTFLILEQLRKAAGIAPV
ncbi:hypothetical protein BSLG_007745 [Batrachochytrium salamandrivorans]|nr:hypothetical protein BSLG_007745 [Batrachochytrium salamandrivorans]